MAGVQLYDYQLEAVQKMRLGCILCGGVGSGKSRTGLAFYYQMFDGKLNTEEYVPMVEPEDLYIITTARKRDTGEWDEELAPFFMSTDESLDLYNHKVVIDSWNNIGKYIGVKRAFFIFDEQRVVGNGSWVKDFLRITRENDWILLSATPGDCCFNRPPFPWIPPAHANIFVLALVELDVDVLMMRYRLPLKVHINQNPFPQTYQPASVQISVNFGVL